MSAGRKLALAAAGLPLLVAALLALRAGGAAPLLHIGAIYRERLPEKLRASAPAAVSPEGFDGQFAHFVALDPVGLAAAPALDAPVVRARRWLLPFLLSVASGFGRLRGALPGLQLAFVALAAAAAVPLALRAAAASGLRERDAARRTILFAAGAPLLLPSTVATGEPLALALLLLSIALRGEGRGRPGAAELPAVAAAALAGLAKETAVLWPLAVVAAELFDRRYRRAALWGASLAPIAFLWGALALRFPGGDAAVAKNLAPPFFGIASMLRGAGDLPLRQAALAVPGAVLFVAFGVAMLLPSGRPERRELRLFRAAAGALAICLAPHCYAYLLDFGRQLFPLAAAAAVAPAATARQSRQPAAAFLAGSALLGAAFVLGRLV